MGVGGKSLNEKVMVPDGKCGKWGLWEKVIGVVGDQWRLLAVVGEESVSRVTNSIATTHEGREKEILFGPSEFSLEELLKEKKMTRFCERSPLTLADVDKTDVVLSVLLSFTNPRPPPPSLISSVE